MLNQHADLHPHFTHQTLSLAEEIGAIPVDTDAISDLWVVVWQVVEYVYLQASHITSNNTARCCACCKGPMTV